MKECYQYVSSIKDISESHVKEKKKTKESIRELRLVFWAETELFENRWKEIYKMNVFSCKCMKESIKIYHCSTWLNIIHLNSYDGIYGNFFKQLFHLISDWQAFSFC